MAYYDAIILDNLKTICWEYQRGNIEEVLFLLERNIPGLAGLSKKVIVLGKEKRYISPGVSIQEYD